MRDDFSDASSLQLVCRSLTSSWLATLVGEEMGCVTSFDDTHFLRKSMSPVVAGQKINKM